MRSGHECRGGRSSIRESGALDRGERRAATGDEGRDGQARRPRRVRDEWLARDARACGLARPRTRSTCGPRSGDGEIARSLLAAAEALQVLLREVEAAVARRSSRDVLEVLGDLEAAADASESAIRSGVAAPKTWRTSSPTGVSGQARSRRGARRRSRSELTVWSRRLASIRRCERLARGSSRLDGDGRQPAQDGMLGHPAGVDAIELGVDPVEQREPVAGRLVADVVDQAREAIDAPAASRAGRAPRRRLATGKFSPAPGHDVHRTGHRFGNARAWLAGFSIGAADAPPPRPSSARRPPPSAPRPSPERPTGTGRS